MVQRQDQKRSDLDEQLREYIAEWRKQRAKEEDELKKLKEKQAKRKVIKNMLNPNSTKLIGMLQNISENSLWRIFVLHMN